MEIEISYGAIVIDVQTLLGNLTDDAKVAFIDALACEDAVIRHVADQILGGWTELGSCGSYDAGGCDPSTVLGQIRREVALRTPEAARLEIARLVSEKRYIDESRAEYRQRAYTAEERCLALERQMRDAQPREGDK